MLSKATFLVLLGLLGACGPFGTAESEPTDDPSAEEPADEKEAQPKATSSGFSSKAPSAPTTAGTTKKASTLGDTFACGTGRCTTAGEFCSHEQNCVPLADATSCATLACPSDLVQTCFGNLATGIHNRCD